MGTHRTRGSAERAPAFEAGAGVSHPSGCALDRVGGRSKAGCPPFAACAAGVDILHGAPVNAPATAVPNRHSPLSGERLRPGSAGGLWCVNTQAWVVIQTV